MPRLPSDIETIVADLLRKTLPLWQTVHDPISQQWYVECLRFRLHQKLSPELQKSWQDWNEQWCDYCVMLDHTKLGELLPFKTRLELFDTLLAQIDIK